MHSTLESMDYAAHFAMFESKEINHFALANEVLLHASQETLVCLKHWKRELEGQLEYAYIVAQLSEAITTMERTVIPGGGR